MEEKNNIGAEIIANTQKELGNLQNTFTAYKVILLDIVAQQEQLRQSGQKNTQQYAQLTQQFTGVMQSVRSTGAEIQQVNGVLTQQQTLINNARSTNESLNKSYQNTTNAVDAFGKVTKSLGAIIGDAAKNFDPINNNLKETVERFEPFKKGFETANTAFANFRANMASGQGVFQSFINSSEGTKKVFNAFKDGNTTFKTLKTAIAETGIGLLIIAVGALTEAFQKCKPVMDVVNGVIAAMGAMFAVLKDSIVGLFTQPIDTIKNFGSSMAGAAKDAYHLVAAQEALEEATNKQEVANEKLKNRIDLLKDDTDNTRLNLNERRNALNEAHRLEEKYNNDNTRLARQAMAAAITDAKTKNALHRDEVENLKKLGTEYAATLLANHQIDEKQYEAIKKADLDLIKLQHERTTSNRKFIEDSQKLKEEEETKNSARQEKAEQRQRVQQQKAEQAAEKQREHLKELKQDADNFDADAIRARTESIGRMAIARLQGYEREITQTQQHYDSLLKTYEKYIAEYTAKAKADPTYARLNRQALADAKQAQEQLLHEKNQALDIITENFQKNDLERLKSYQIELEHIQERAGKSALETAVLDLGEEEKSKMDAAETSFENSKKRQNAFQLYKNKNYKKLTQDELTILNNKIDKEITIQTEANKLKTDLAAKLKTDIEQLKDQDQKNNTEKAEKDITDSIQQARQQGDAVKAIHLQQQLLNMQHEAELKSFKGTEEEKKNILKKYNQEKLDLELGLVQARMHAGDRLINAVLKNTKKDSVAYKAAFAAKKAIAIGDVIIDTKKAVVASLSAYSGIPFIGQALGIAQAAFMAVQGANSIAEIVKQKPGFARGGQYLSDGRGALLPGYSRTDDTNAYLRSGEAVVVSEAMANPWARNLVSAINVMHGGRDFSVANPGRGYAVGGIFTDGGNANRYYSQPMQDQQQLANTLAYQLINNFPPIYVDVKDVNNQQNILAQTVNRVNL